MSLEKKLNAGFSDTHSSHGREYIGNASETEFTAATNVSGVTKVEAWVSNEWVERALKDPNDGNPGSTQYTFTNPYNKPITVKYGTAPAASVADVKTLTFQAHDKFKVSDYIILNNVKDNQKYGIYFNTTEDVAQVDEITLPTKASLDNGEFFTFKAKSGLKIAVQLDVSGDSDAPTASNWLDADKKIVVDLSDGGIVSGINVATAIETALLTLDEIAASTGSGVLIALTRDGAKLIFTQEIEGAVGEPETFGFTGTAQVDNVTFLAKANHDDGEFLLVSTAGGSKYAVILKTNEATTSTHTALLAVPEANIAVADLTLVTSADSVANKVKLAFNSLPNFTDKIDIDRAAGVLTFTQLVKGECDAPISYDYVGDGVPQVDTVEFPEQSMLDPQEFLVISAQDETSYAIMLDKAGSLPDPTSATEWDATDVQLYVDLSGASTATEVATAVKAKLETLNAFKENGKIAITQTTGVLTLTQSNVGVCDAPVSYDYAETAKVTIAQDTAGVDATLNVTIAQDTEGNIDPNLTIAQATEGVDGDPVPAAISALNGDDIRKLNVYSAANSATIATNFVTALEAITNFSTNVITLIRTNENVAITQAVAGDAPDFTSNFGNREEGEDNAWALVNTTKGKTTTSRINFTQAGTTLYKNLNSGF